MKAVIIVPSVQEKEKKRRKPRREQHIVLSRKLWKIEPGYLGVMDKGYFAKATHIEVKKYLKNIYRGEFVLIGESKKEYIIQRIKTDVTKEASTNTEDRRRRFYFPQRKTSDS